VPAESLAVTPGTAPDVAVGAMQDAKPRLTTRTSSHN
jgi:hypothetical protein